MNIHPCILAQKFVIHPFCMKLEIAILRDSEYLEQNMWVLRVYKLKRKKPVDKIVLI